MTKQSLKLALLVCDIPLSEVVEKYGDYTKQYPVVFEKAAKKNNITITWEFFDVVEAQAYPSLVHVESQKYDAIVITGSKYNAHDNDPWILRLVDFLKTVQQERYANSVKLVGVCFGHQTLLRAAGGVCGRNPKGWEAGYTKIELNEFGKLFFDTDKTELRVNQVHRDYVYVLPEGFKILAFTKDNTENHATVSDNGQCITIQGHPEFNRGTMRMVIESRLKSGIMPKEDALQWLHTLDTVSEEMDDVWIVEKFIDFIITK